MFAICSPQEDEYPTSSRGSPTPEACIDPRLLASAASPHNSIPHSSRSSSKPNRPRGAFSVFRSDLMREGSPAGVAGKHWRNLSKEQKNNYKLVENIEKIVYDLQHPACGASHKPKRGRKPRSVDGKATGSHSVPETSQQELPYTSRYAPSAATHASSGHFSPLGDTPSTSTYSNPAPSLNDGYSGAGVYTEYPCSRALDHDQRIEEDGTAEELQHMMGYINI